MTRLLILVEGQAEEIFVKQTLTPYLAPNGVYVEKPALLWTRRKPEGGGHRGGTVSWGQIRRDLTGLLGDKDAWVTTLLDFYGLPDDCPGLETQGDALTRVRRVQQAMAESLRHPRFLPFLALHELEAWIFSDPDQAEAHANQPGLADRMRQTLADVGTPEAINHGPATHPKARLKTWWPSYKETSDGPNLLKKIGIETIRIRCPHADAWLSQLLDLSHRGP